MVVVLRGVRLAVCNSWTMAALVKQKGRSNDIGKTALKWS